MILEFINSLEADVPKLVLVHIIISAIFSGILAEELVKRYVIKNKKLLDLDDQRFKEFESSSFLHKMFFDVSRHNNNAYTGFIFLFLLNISIPIIGYFASLWITWYLLNIKYEKKVSKTGTLNLDEFKISFLKVERIFGEGSMSDLMTNKYAPKSKKLQALSSLANDPSPSDLKIIRQTLYSTDDEIRMFGYAIINKEELKLNKKINTQLSIFKDKKSPQDVKAKSAKELAFLYWNLVYTELAHESLKDSFLDEVVKYLEISKSFFFPEIERLENLLEKLYLNESNSNNIENYANTLKEYKDIRIKLFVLSGRVHMKRSSYSEAAKEFSLAQELNENDSSFILPYLAEVHFLTKNYKITQALLNSAKDLELNSKLYPIVEQWRVNSKVSIS